MKQKQSLLMLTQVTLVELWVGLINIKLFKLEQMLILQEMLNKLMLLVQQVLVFAEQNICSLLKTELLQFVK